MEEKKVEEFDERARKKKKEAIIKWLLFYAACAGTGFILGRLLGKWVTKEAKKLQQKEMAKILEEFELTPISSGRMSRISPFAEGIDEEIFTEVAPEIELAVLNYGIEEYWSERTFKLDNQVKKMLKFTVTEIKD